MHTGFVSVPDGAVTEVGILPGLPIANGATYDAASNKWFGTDRQLLSPDETRYTYWAADPAHDEIHVVDTATGTDRTIYNGPTLYIPIAFTNDAIYVVHAINPRQGAYELLFRLDPAGGGTPQLVAGSDRHMYQYGWVLISDGAAWGIDYLVQGSARVYTVLRLDLVSGQVTRWLEGPPDDQFWPLGTDKSHRLYVDDHQQLWRLGLPDQVEQLPNPGPITLDDNVAGPTAMISDSLGAWFPGRGGVWLYSDSAPPKRFNAGEPTDDVFPAGPCL
jgi:hypothetical protein